MRILDTLCVGLAVLAGLILVALIGLTFVDVVMRYIFSSPIFGARDLLETGMVIVISLAFPLTWRAGGHIVVDLIPDYGMRALTVVRDLVVRAIGIFIFGVLAWRCWLRADDAALFNEATNMIEVPFQPFFWILSAAALFQTLVLVIECIWLIASRSIAPDASLTEMPEDAASAD